MRGRRFAIAIRQVKGKPTKSWKIFWRIKGMLHSGAQPDSISPLKVFNSLRNQVKDLKYKDILDVMRRMREKGILRRLSRQKHLTTLEKEKLKARLFTPSSKVREYVTKLIAEGGHFEEIIPSTIYEALKDEVTGFTPDVIKAELVRLRRKGVLTPYSAELRSRIAAMLRKRALARASPTPAAQVRNYITEQLTKGISPDAFSATETFKALKENIPGLKFKTVEDTLRFMRKEGALKRLSKDKWSCVSSKGSKERWEKVSTEERSIIAEKAHDTKRRKELEAIMAERRKRAKEELSAMIGRAKIVTKIAEEELIKNTINTIRRTTNLGGIGDKDLFFEILEHIIRGRRLETIVILARREGYILHNVDVAVVAFRAAQMLENLRENSIRTKEFEQVRDLLNKSAFWNNLSLYREILRKESDRLERHIDVVIAFSLKRLGLRITQ